MIIKTLRTSLCILLLLWSVTSYATDYYVDASGGSDGNSGTSPASAWKTAAKVNASKFSAGDRILFKKGEAWRETLLVPSSGSAGNPIIFSSYGSGANPLITGSDLIVNGWSADGGNRWKATVSAQPNVLYINGIRGTRVSSASAVTSANTWYWASSTLFVYSPANGDPSKYYTAPGIEAGARQIAIDCNDKTDITIDGFTLRDGNAINFVAGIVRTGSVTSLNITIKNCLIERGRSMGVEATGSGTASNLLIDNCTIQNNGSFAVLFEHDHDNTKILNSQILSNGWASGIDGYQTSNIQGNLAGVEVAFCNIYNGAPGVAYADDQCHGIYVSSPGSGFAYIHDNTISGNSNGAGIKARQSCYVVNNVIYNNRLEGVELGGNGAADAVYYVVKNRFYGSTSGFPAVSEFAKGSGHISLNIFNNTSYKNGVIGAEVSIADNIDTLRILNNIFYAANGRYAVQIPNMTGVKVIDYNLYWRDDGGGAPINKYNTSVTNTLSSWQGMGFDLNGLNVNPMLMSPTSNFQLSTGSPAIDKGTKNVNVPYSGASPDLGAIEAGGLGNVPPTAFAGNDTSITLPANLVKLLGTGKDADGSIASYAWTKVSGPASGTLVTPGTSNTDASGLVAGTYVFRLTVTDNLGATGSDDIQVTVNAAAPPPNQKPTANAGSDVSITLPTSSVKLNGSGTDPDGTIASYSWTVVSGPTGGSIQSPAVASTDVLGLVVGTYVYRLTVTDDKGATATDDIQVTVTAAIPPPNQSPITNAGTDVTITLPTSATSFTSSASDPDGTISTYTWSQVSGPNTASIAAPAAASTNVSGLVVGTYVFNITVTDNGGATATDNVQVTVNAAIPPPNQSPITNAGSDVTITLPNSTTSFTSSASDPDGTISTYTWSQVSGPNTASIATPAAASTNVSGLVAGTYVFNITVTDNGGATATDNIQVTVNAPPNQSPITNAGTDATITLPTSTTSFASSASDPDGTISTYAWSQVSGPNTATIASPAAASTSVSGLVVGTYVFNITVTDNAGATATDNVQVTVNAALPPPNQVPTTNAGSDVTITLPTSTASFTGSASDADGTISTYTWSQVSGPNTASIATPAAASTDVSGLVAGTYVFKMTVIDNAGATATDNVQVTVNPSAGPPPNQSPTTTAGSNVTITLPTSTTSFTASASDPDGTISTYTWSQVSGPNTATIASPAAASTSVSGLVAGTYVFRITVKDDGGATAADDVQVTVNAAPVNKVPAVNAGSNVTITLPTSTASFTASASDPDGTISAYTWSQVSGPNTASIATPAVASTNISGLIAGTYVFRMTVTDNGGATAADDVKVTVKAAALPPPNQAPTTNAGSDVTITLPTSTTSFNASASDADGTISTYTWSQVSGPNTASIATPAVASTNISGLIAGNYVFRMTVTDNDGATAADDVQVTVNAAALPPPNQAPSTNAGSDVTITLPTSATSFTASASDADGTISTYTWSQVSGPNTASIATPAVVSTNISGLIAGTYVFRITVKDNGGATATDDVQVTVNAAALPPPNQAPTANAGSDVTITLPTSTTSFTASASDADGTVSTYTWSQVSGPNAASIATPAVASTNISGLIAGTYVFRITVKDNGGATAADDVQVTVKAAALPPPNQAPTTNAGSDVTITLPTSTASFTASASDADGTISTYTWSQVSGPNAASIASPASASTNVSGLIAGTYVFKISVKDNGGATATDNVQVTVNTAAGPPPNQSPSVTVGSNVTITLPTSTTSFTASGSDPDGTISTYTWSQVSGPNTASIATPAVASTNISGLVAGTYVFRITVKDNGGATATDDVQVTVNSAPVNQAPIVNAGSDISITLPISTADLNAFGNDTDGSIASYTWKEIAGPNTATLATAGSSSTNVSGLIAGNYTFRVTVIDNGGATANDDIIVTVNAAPPPPNVLPTANAGTDVTITLPINSVTLNGTGTDTDGTIAQYKWSKVSGPAGGTIQTSTAAATTISALSAGVYLYRLTVTDNNGGSATDNVQITVNSIPVAPTDQPPSANAGANTTITLPAGLSLNGSGADVDGTVASFAWTKVSGPAAAIQNANSSSTNVTGIVAGTYVFRLTVTDNQGATATDDVQVLVLDATTSTTPVNQLPSANAGANLVITLPTNSVFLSGAGTDADGSIASYTWSKVSGPTGGAIQTPNASATGVDNFIAGSYVYRLTVTDNQGASASDDIQIQVNTAPAAPSIPNLVPIAVAGSDQKLTLPNNSVILDGSQSSDPDGSIVNYFWIRVQGPGSVTFDNGNTVSPTISGLQKGTYVFELTVTDNNGATATDRVTITVGRVNQKPKATVAADTVSVNLPVQNSLLDASTSTDPDGAVASYNWAYVDGPTSPRMMNPDSSKTVVTGLVVGTYEFLVTVTDDEGAVDQHSVVVVVNPGATRLVVPTITMYPNPAQSFTNITMEISDGGRAQIILYDAHGRPVKVESFVKPQGTYTYHISLATLARGTYVVVIKLENSVNVVKKLIKF